MHCLRRSRVELSHFFIRGGRGLGERVFRNQHPSSTCNPAVRVGRAALLKSCIMELNIQVCCSFRSSQRSAEHSRHSVLEYSAAANSQSSQHVASITAVRLPVCCKQPEFASLSTAKNYKLAVLQLCKLLSYPPAVVVTKMHGNIFLTKPASHPVQASLRSDISVFQEVPVA